jgi:signal transduction histidine kinase
MYQEMTVTRRAKKQPTVRHRPLRPARDAAEGCAQELLRALVARLEAAREAERLRVSRELHDSLGEVLTGMEMTLGWMHLVCTESETVPSGPLLERLKTLNELTSGLAGRVRQLCCELHPAVLEDLGLAAAITWQAAEFHKRTGIRCATTLDNDKTILSPAQATALYRIFEETLTNVARHSKASKVKVKLACARHQVTLEVKDNGRGLRPEQATSMKSLGLLGMREQAAWHGGHFHIAGRPGKGTCVTVVLPAARAAVATPP